jgi:glucose/arabinose dehydrogenase
VACAALARGLAAPSRAAGAERVLIPLAARPGLVITPVGGGFDQVTSVTNAGDGRLFIAQRDGLVYVRRADGTTSVFLDIRDRVNPDGAEYGFFDLAFHPDYSDPESPGFGLFFVTYTGDADGKLALYLSRFRFSANPDAANPASEARLLRIRQQSPLHKGGGLDFNRLDNRLFMGVGEDTEIALAQDMRSQKGKLLRVTVDDVPPELTGNAEGRAAIDIWALGLRNPWRVDVDETSGRVYLGDVGSGAWEEVNSVPLQAPGANFGWPCREGPDASGDGYGIAACTDGRTFEEPLYAYAHGEYRCAIIGGHVVRDPVAPGGRYVFADVCSNEILTVAISGPATGQARVAGVLEGVEPIISLGEDAGGNPYAGVGGPARPVFRLTLP